MIDNIYEVQIILMRNTIKQRCRFIWEVVTLRNILQASIDNPGFIQKKDDPLYLKLIDIHNKYALDIRKISTSDLLDDFYEALGWQDDECPDDSVCAMQRYGHYPWCKKHKHPNDEKKEDLVSPNGQQY